MAVDNEVVVSNILWRYAERFFAQGMTFIVSLVLARLLDPDEYGTIAIVYVIISIFEVFSSRGFVQALIQKKSINSIDYSTVFYTNLFLEVFLYILLFYAAPFIAFVFKNQVISLIIRILGLRMIVNSFNSVQQAYVQRKMQFKKFFFSTSLGTAISGIVGIIMAYKGFGVWSLVAQSLINPIIDTIVLFIVIEWKPKLEYSVEALKTILSYGSKMFAAGLLESIYDEIRSLVIGKVYSSSDLAYYNKGQGLPSLAITNLQVSIGNVFFSALSREDSYEATKQRMRSYLRLVFYVICPVMIGLSLVAEPLLVVLYTEKWLPAKPYLIIYAFSYLTWVPQMTWLQGINSRGRAGLSLKLLVVHRIIGISLIILLLKKGPIYIAISALVADCIISTLIFLSIHKLFAYTFGELLEDIKTPCFLTLVMSAIILSIQSRINNYSAKLIVSVLVGVVAYLFLSKIIKAEGYVALTGLIKGKLKKQKAISDQ